MPDHPSTRELAAFLAAGPSLRSERSRVARHLLRGCDLCHRRLRILNPGERLRSGRSLSSPPALQPLVLSSEVNYDRAFAAAERNLEFFLVEGRPVTGPPGRLLAELGPFEEEGARSGDPAHRLAIPFLTRWLIEKSHSFRYSDPAEMLHWALMARLAGAGCSSNAAGNQAKLADLRARAEAQLSNALRVTGRIGEAEDCMKTAWDELARGTGDPELRATIFLQTTSLLILQKNFQLATDLSLDASLAYEDLGSRHRSAAAKVTGATAVLYNGDPEGAADILQQALPQISLEEDPNLLVVTRHNLVRCYIDLGLPAKALAAHQRLQRVRLDIEPLILLRMDWHEALLLGMLQDPRASAQLLSRVRRRYIERHLVREAIVATRDLAKVLTEIGESERAAIVLEETAEWIRGMSFGSEASSFFAELQPTIA